MHHYKIYPILILNVLLLASCLTTKGNSPDVPEMQGDNIHPLAIIFRDAEFTFPGKEEAGGKTIKLHNGYGEYKESSDSSPGRVNLENFYSVWESEDGKRTDFLALFKLRPGGSGVFSYLVLFDVSNSRFTARSTVFLGDRIELYGLNMREGKSDNDYSVVVKLLDREEKESMSATPVQKQILRFEVKEQDLLDS